ncbi:MAG: MgtC/SapB family protein [Planctomycetales bacterium]
MMAAAVMITEFRKHRDNNQMDWQAELLILWRVALSTVLGGLIGFERHLHGREAGVRTYAAVALGACAFSAISQHLIGPTTDPSRIASNVVTGMGFLGAGVILRDKGRTTGLTTAATLWATAAVGMALGFDMYLLGPALAVLILIVLASHRLPGLGSEGSDDPQNPTEMPE